MKWLSFRSPQEQPATLFRVAGCSIGSLRSISAHPWNEVLSLYAVFSSLQRQCKQGASPTQPSFIVSITLRATPKQPLISNLCHSVVKCVHQHALYALYSSKLGIQLMLMLVCPRGCGCPLPYSTSLNTCPIRAQEPEPGVFPQAQSRLRSLEVHL